MINYAYATALSAVILWILSVLPIWKPEFQQEFSGRFFVIAISLVIVSLSLFITTIISK